MNAIIKKSMQRIHQLCVKYKVLRLYVFGSVVNDSFSHESDIDLLVTFLDIPLLDYADYYFDFKFALEDLLGRKIDLITERSLTNPYLIESINYNKKLIYGRENTKIPV